MSILFCHGSWDFRQDSGIINFSQWLVEMAKSTIRRESLQVIVKLGNIARRIFWKSVCLRAFKPSKTNNVCKRLQKCYEQQHNRGVRSGHRAEYRPFPPHFSNRSFEKTIFAAPYRRPKLILTINQLASTPTPRTASRQTAPARDSMVGHGESRILRR
jgi:hypothetical protein